MLSPLTCPVADTAPDAEIPRQLAAIAELERALWAGGLNEALLAPCQAAYRRLEALLVERHEERHGFVVVIPVADNPRQTRACLDSLLELCRAFDYGGMADGRYRKVRVLLADDSRDAAAMAAHRALAGDFTGQGLAVEYFGLEEQLALLDSLEPAADLAGTVGVHAREAFAHKGQAMTRNIAYLRFAGMAASDPRLLCLTVDGDQVFKVKVATPAGAREVCAVNFLYHLDEIFRRADVRVLTGKVVGDPPVSPAVMAGNFLDDVIGFLSEMARAEPGRPYRQPVLDTRGSGDAAYHDMADLFGFRNAADAYRFHCDVPGDGRASPSNADCFAVFSRRLHSFFHGEHPTRVTWYSHADALASLQPARTVYTGNYVFRPEALDWFIPFAPLRLRMSGPTMGRMLRAEMGGGFVAANLPMLHRRTVADTGASEFRPGILVRRGEIDLCGEFERQFHGDVMLFAMERLTERGFPGRAPEEAEIDAILAAMQVEMGEKYRAWHRAIRDKLAAMEGLLGEPARWWNRGDELAEARENFRAFAANLEHNFGAGSPCLANIASASRLADWRARQRAAIAGFRRDREAWRRALAALAP
jgi:hypothetical protein